MTVPGRHGGGNGAADWATNQAAARAARVPLRRRLRVASVSCGVQFGWALQFSLLTPYVQELGIPHVWSCLIRLCGPRSGLLVQPLVGHKVDRCTSRFGHRWPFIAAGATALALAVLLIGQSADLDGLRGDRGPRRHCAVSVFVLRFWLLDVANNVTQGPALALLADLTGFMHDQVVVSVGSGPWDQLFGGENAPDGAVAAVAAFVSVLIAIVALDLPWQRGGDTIEIAGEERNSMA